MNKEEIEELKDFTIDLTDIDELALGLEVCSKKSNMVIQEFADTIIQLQQQNQKYKEVIDKSREYLTSYSSIHTIQFGTENDSLNDIELNKTLDEKTLNEMTNRYLKVHDKLLDILKEVSE